VRRSGHGDAGAELVAVTITAATAAATRDAFILGVLLEPARAALPVRPSS
jgi:hypothetical protein